MELGKREEDEEAEAEEEFVEQSYDLIRFFFPL
jgi:hypothetical protein